jgi:hypothetical protein
MYSWIWRHLPFGLAGRIIGSLLVVAGLAALLWYQVFPNVEQYMPFTDGQVTSDGGDSVQQPPNPSADPSVPPADVIPYSTVSNNPEPTPTR